MDISFIPDCADTAFPAKCHSDYAIHITGSKPVLLIYPKVITPKGNGFSLTGRLEKRVFV